MDTKLIQELIINSDVDLLEKKLLDLNLFILDNNECDELLFNLLNFSIQNNKKDIVRKIISIFDVERIKVDVLPTLTNLFLNQYMEKDILILILECFNEKLPIDYLVDLINMGNDTEAVNVAKYIFDIYPNITYDDWKQLVSMTENVEDEEYSNIELRNFFINRLKYFNISKFNNDILIDNNKFQEIFTKNKNLPQVKDVLPLILENMLAFISYEKTKDIDIINNAIMIKYSMSSSLDKIKMLKSSNIEEYKDIEDFDDIELFNLLGPVNTMYSNLEINEYQCFKYGGCRMLVCSHFEEIDKNGYKIDIFDDNDIELEWVKGRDIELEWFRGKCDECDNKILSKTHSIRQPLLYGGWKGCYCSIICLKKQIDYKTSENQLMLTILNDLLKLS